MLNRSSLSLLVLVAMVGVSQAQPSSPSPPADNAPAPPPAAFIAPSASPRSAPYGTGPTSTSPLTAAAPAAPPELDVEQAFLSDAAAASSYLMPTALLPRAGSCSLYDYDLVVLGATCSVTDRVQVGVTTAIGGDGIVAVAGSAKVQVYRGRQLRVALHGAGLLAGFSNDGDGDGFGALGVASTVCVDATCTSHLSGYLGIAGPGDSDDNLLVLGAAGLVLRVGGPISLVGELDLGFDTGAASVDEQAANMVWYGLRYTSRHASIDAGLASTLGGSGSFGLLPILGLTFRT